MMAQRRRHAIYAEDVRGLGGVVSVVPSRDLVDGETFFKITHISSGRDVVWTSPRIDGEQNAEATARILADFVGAEVRR